MPTDKIALEFLSSLEKAELQLLSWGLTDGFFSADELIERAGLFLAEKASGGCDVSAYAEPWALLEALLDAKLLWSTPNPERFRTRMAEAVRLFARLRQIFPDASFQGWRTAPGLVADYRLLVRAREYPRRDIKAVSALAEIRKGRPASDLEDHVLKGFLAVGTDEERKLAGFQVRATKRMLAVPVGDRARGTVVCAGTGSGKTLAFYLPAFAAIASKISNEHWTKCLALYPRNELLKDQLREALVNANRVESVVSGAKHRGISLGALYGDVPRDARKVLDGSSVWSKVNVDGRPGYECPFVRCPACKRNMIWLEQDARNGVERLRCSRGCNEVVKGDTVRLTRESLLARPPDVLFTSTEMLNQRLSSSRYSKLLGLGMAADRRPLFVLVDEAHTYEGPYGAHVALLLRRWKRASDARPHFVGLSATLADAGRFFSDLVGVGPGDVVEEGPLADELESEGAEYQLALRGDPATGTSLLSTTIQSIMLLRRVLAPRPGSADFGSKVFAFTDNLDVVNRLFHTLRDAEGWTSFGQPNTRRPGGSLANLRGTALPSARDRWIVGQQWRLVEDIGHVLAPNARVAIDRTSSQDQGVNSAAEVIVATSSLEVGFDDEEVGAVLQHKAPQSAAAFLQRKGRAGRRRGMRPWTVVVLSDYGRDRIAYQSYEQMFDPSLPARYLPLGNRAVMRMQASYALMEWLARKLAGVARPEPWSDLAQPASIIEFDGMREAVARRQAAYVPVLKSLLDHTLVREDLAQFLRRALATDEDVITALLWEPPRGLLTEVVPTLLRRLETGWKRADDKRLEENQRGAPMPEFVPRALFADLQLPEVLIMLPALGRIQARSEAMPIAQALREFAPGRVSRRFGTTHGGESHWIDPGPNPVLDVGTFCPSESRQRLGEFRIRIGGVLEDLVVFRPLSITVTTPPRNVPTTSNAFLEWQTQIVPGADRVALEPPSGSVWSNVVSEVGFYTHVQGGPLEVRRCTTGVRASVAMGNRSAIDTDISFVTADAQGGMTPCGLGFVADVDGVQVTFKYPVDLTDRVRGDAVLMRSLRPKRFRDILRTNTALDGLANGFQRDWLAQAYFSTVALEALRAGISLPMAEERVYARSAPTSVDEVVRTILQWSDSQDGQVADEVDDEGVGPDAEGTANVAPEQGAQPPRRVRELLGLIAPGPVWEALHLAAGAFTDGPDAGWDLWVRQGFRSTLAAAFLDAAQRLCPEMDGDALLVDVDVRADKGSADEQVDEFWLSEATIGGGGFIEQLFEKYGEDPRRFFRLVDASLGASELEQVAQDIGQVVSRVGFDAEDGALLRTCFRQVREARAYQESLSALEGLRDALSRSGIQPAAPLLTALNSRVLRPGTTAQIDRFVAEKQKRWVEAEERLGVEVDVRVFALVEATDSALERALGVPAPGGTAQAATAWRYGVLYGMFWPRGSQIRAEALQSYNPYGRLPDADRLIVVATVKQATEIISLIDPGWFDSVSRILVRDGVAQVEGAAAVDVSEALLRLAADPVDSSGVLVFARVAAVTREGNSWRATLELPEAFQ